MPSRYQLRDHFKVLPVSHWCPSGLSESTPNQGGPDLDGLQEEERQREQPQANDGEAMEAAVMAAVRAWVLALSMGDSRPGTGSFFSAAFAMSLVYA